jgi:hypothetical protein
MVKKEEHKEKVESKLNQWKEWLTELEENIEKVGGKAQAGLKKGLDELKEQKLKVQEGFEKLKRGSEKAYEDGKKGLDSAIEKFEEGYEETKAKIGEVVGKTRKKTLEVKDEIIKTTLWEKVEKGFDDAWEVSKKAASKVSEEMGKVTKKTRLHVENHRLKGQVSKIFAQIGGEVYNKIIREGRKTYTPDKKNKELLQKAFELEQALDKNMESLHKAEK